MLTRQLCFFFQGGGSSFSIDDSKTMGGGSTKQSLDKRFAAFVTNNETQKYCV
jgi:hypothetical protein